MRLGDIDLPDDLLEAHHGGRLVVFVGAGVSRPLPTGIPTFQGMANQHGREAGVQRGRVEPPDVYLGRALAASYPVHDRVVEVINRGGGTNVLHDAVMGLFKTAGDVRVVTTNFDRHLSNAAPA